MHAAWNRFQSHAGSAFFPGGRSLRAEQRMSIGVGVLTDQSDWLLSHSQRCTRETVSDSSFSVCLSCFLISRQRNERKPVTGLFLFLPFFFLTTCFSQKVKLFVVKKSSSCACV